MKRFEMLAGLSLSAAIHLASGLAFAGPGEHTSRGSARVYPGVSFQDGRDRDTSGNVTPLATTFGAPSSGDPDDFGPFAACFEEGYEATLEEMQALNLAIADGYISRYNAVDRWTGTSGTPITLSWSFIPDGTDAPDLNGNLGDSNLFARMDQLFGAANRQTWVNQFINSFNRWGALTGVTYERIMFNGNDWDDGASWGSGGSANRGDIRIAMRNFGGAGGVLAFNSFPDNGDMVLDSSESWATSANTYRFLRNTIMHEHGHGLGFAHVCPTNNTKLMEPFLNTNFDGPMQDDVRGGQFFYGDAMESNNTPTLATDLGTLNPGTTTSLGAISSPSIANTSMLSLRSSDNDYFKYTIDGPKLVNITVTPVGSTYTDLDQNGDGSCQTTPANNTNSLTQGDIQVSAYASNGTTLWRTQNLNEAGSNEAIVGLLVNDGLNYFRIYPDGAISQTQCYTLSITIQNTSLACNASDGTFNDFVRVTWPAIPDATGYIVMRNTTDSTVGATQLASLGVVTTFDDATATPGTTYYYFIRAQQTGSTTYRYMTASGNSGFRPVVNQNPTANAGPDQNLVDTDDSGSEFVTLNGSASTDPDGNIVLYTWSEGATQLFSGAAPSTQVSLAVGVHNITLVVTDDDGATGNDQVTITVEPAPPPACDPDVNCDGSPDQGDVACMILAIAGDTSCICQDPDFNLDGSADQGDVAALIAVVAGQPCP